MNNIILIITITILFMYIFYIQQYIKNLEYKISQIIRDSYNMDDHIERITKCIIELYQNKSKEE
jgi:hypothetical protein